MPGGGKVWIAIHMVSAAAFFFVLQRYLMSATLESSLIWAAAGAAGAGYLAWQQSTKR